MPRALDGPEGPSERILAATRSWAFVGALTACFAAVEALLLRSGRMIHDEGLTTWLYASYLSRDPVATLFFLKAKPALAVLNLPGTEFGLLGFYVGHVVIGCAGVLAMAAAARSAGVREWGVATLLYAASPMYVFGTAAGFSNVDAAALTALALWTLFRPSRPGLGAGLVLSLLPWVRFESTVFVVVSGLALLVRDRNPRFVVGLLLLPIAYLAAGGVWHHDLLWFWDFPATFADIKKTGLFAMAEEQVARTSFADLAFAVSTVTPVLGVAVLPEHGDPPWVRAGQLCTVLFLAAIVGLPLAGAAMGYSQRYFLQILPVVALLVAHRAERRPRAAVVATIAVIAACAALLSLRPPFGARAVFAIVALGGTSCLVTLAWRERLRLATVAASVLALCWPFAPLPLDSPRPGQPVGGQVATIVEWLRTHSTARPSPVVVTNVKLLDAFLALSRAAPPADVHCLIQVDNEYELTQLTNPANGQRARILALAKWRFYGSGVLAREFAESPGPPGALVVLREDPRLGALSPSSLVARGAEVLWVSDRLTILRLP